MGLHGSMQLDIDIMAILWTEKAKLKKDLIKALSDCLGETIWSDHHFIPRYDKLHGRIVYTLSIGGTWYLNISVIEIMEI